MTTTQDPEDIAIASEVSVRLYNWAAFDPETRVDAALLEVARLAREAAERRLSAPQVEPRLLRAREYVAQEFEERGMRRLAAEARTGERDENHDVQSVLRAIDGEAEHG